MFLLRGLFILATYCIIIGMNQKARKEFAAKHDRIMTRMESPFHKPIARAIHQQILDITQVLKEQGMTAAMAANERYIVNLHLKLPIENIYKVFGLYMARRTTREINKSTRHEQKAGFGFDLEFLKQIIAYLQQYVFNRVILPITQTTRDLILKKLIEGEEKGWGVDQIVRELELPDMTVGRARTIVRTESLKALQFGQETAGAKSRWQYVSEWISARDHRTRHSHRIVDGEQVDEGTRFAVPIFKRNIQIGVDLMKGPGDPQASAGNVINCRCTLVTVAKRDNNGRLVLKNPTNSNISLVLQ